MAMARTSRWTAKSLLQLASAARSFHPAAPSSALSSSSSSSSSYFSSSAQRPSSFASSPSFRFLPAPQAAPDIVRTFGTATASFRTASAFLRGPCPSYTVSNPSAGSGPPPTLSWTMGLRLYSKRPKKWQGGPHAYIQVEPGQACPPYQPNEGSVKNRKHNKRMAQRHAFVKAQAQRRKQETKAAVIKRDAARRKRWREGTARAQAWAKHLQELQANAVSA